MCWLRMVEVALTSAERQQKDQEEYVEQFFRPFRELGRKQKAERELSLLKGKVIEAYKRFDDGTLELLERDRYLFTRRTLEEQLAGEEAKLMRWLKSLELALHLYTRQHETVRAAQLFQSFLVRGRQRVQASRCQSQESSDEISTGTLWSTKQRVQNNHISREIEQIGQELSPPARTQYWLRRQKVQPIEGLQGTVFEIDVTQDTSDIDSILIQGPFNQFLSEEYDSMSDSGYSNSSQSDVPMKFNTDHSEMESTIDLAGYKAERFAHREAQITKLSTNLDRIYRGYAAARKTKRNITVEGTSDASLDVQQSESTKGESTIDSSANSSDEFNMTRSSTTSRESCISLERDSSATTSSQRSATMIPEIMIGSPGVSHDLADPVCTPTGQGFPETEFHAMLRFLQRRKRMPFLVRGATGIEGQGAANQASLSSLSSQSSSSFDPSETRL